MSARKRICLKDIRLAEKVAKPLYTGSGNIRIYASKYCTEAKGLMEGSGTLSQFILEHEGRFSPFFALSARLGEALQHWTGGSRSEYEKQMGLKLVITPPEDPDNIGFHEWTPVLYACGDTAMAADKAISFLKKYLQFLKDQGYVKTTENYSIELICAGSFVLGDVDNREYTVRREHVTLRKILSAAPPKGRSIVYIDVEAGATQATLTIVVTGATFAFRSQFDEHAYEGGHAEDESGKTVYTRVLRDVDASQGRATQLAHKLGVDILGGFPALVDVEDSENSYQSEFLRALLETERAMKRNG